MGEGSVVESGAVVGRGAVVGKVRDSDRAIICGAGIVGA